MNKVTISAIVVAILLIVGIWYQIESKQNNSLSTTGDSYFNESSQNENNTVTTTSTSTPKQEQPIIKDTNPKAMKATLHTSKGDITIEFFDKKSPNTVENFKKLANDKFYDGVKFHRVIKGFMIQGGDPLTKDDTKKDFWGTGGPGYKFADEIAADNHNDTGTIAMANSGPNTNGSQFFINVANNNFLDTKHTVFGKVTSGMEIVTAIENTPTDPSDRPVEAVVIKSITLD